MFEFVLSHRRELFGPPFWLGVAVGVATGITAARSHDVLASATGTLTTETLLGVGLLATVLAALAILATFFDQTYRAALQELSGSFLRAVLPFRIVAFSGAIAAAGGVAAITFWGVMSDDVQAASFGLVTAATVTAIFGTWELVRDTTFHGVKRDELLELDYRR